ncbi:MAG: hypothetical protein RR444_12230, partial [Oscillospiraceae bacterium]
MKKLYKFIALILMISISIGSFTSCKPIKPSEEIKIRVILKSMEINFWKVVIAGVNIATSEYKADVEVKSPNNEED